MLDAGEDALDRLQHVSGLVGYARAGAAARPAAAGLLDEHIVPAPNLADAASLLDRSVPHLVRCFHHAYLIGRRIEAVRRHPATRELMSGGPGSRLGGGRALVSGCSLCPAGRAGAATSPSAGVSAVAES